MSKKNSKQYLICFKLISYCIVLDYKNLKIIKKFDFSNNFSFNLYKPENEYDYFYIIFIDEYKNPKLQVHKYSNDLKIIDKFATSFGFPEYKLIPYEDGEEDEEDNEDNDSMTCENECIYKSIVTNTNNFVFLYHKSIGAPLDVDGCFLYFYKNGELHEKTQLGLAYLEYESGLNFDIKEIDDEKLILAKGNKDNEIKEVEFLNFENNNEKTKMKNKVKKNKKDH